MKLANAKQLHFMAKTWIHRLAGFSTSAQPTNLPLPKKLLVANRGEIACRVMRTCKRLGVKTVAVHSDVDSKAQHVLMADEAVCIGGAAAADSYLKYDRIIAACKKTGATAVHPGYGFLSENEKFATVLPENGITFVGPPPPAIKAMGSKSESKKIMIDADVPVIPGYHGDEQDIGALQVKADAMGYPLLIKAVLGGGGKGMRICNKSEDFVAAAESSRREAIASFADDRLLLERYILNPRHVELQVFADTFGNVVHLFERDCSLQRRYQKVIEEAPAPHMTEELRKEMGDAAVAAAKAVGYVGAGTVEFILEPNGDFYFMEMNTRLQVEHPVTEMVTGQDLVEWQLRVAAGNALPLTQEQLALNGHSFEARVYAERPEKGFLPATGHLTHVNTPSIPGEPEAVRVESGVVQGDTVSVHYDPMIAKLVVWAEDREQALRRLVTCLRDYQIVGVPTNIDFLLSCANHPVFKDGTATTAFIDDEIDQLLPPNTATAATLAASIDPTLYAVAAVGSTLIKQKGGAAAGGGAWGHEALSNFRVGVPAVQHVAFEHGEDEDTATTSLTVTQTSGGFTVTSAEGEVHQMTAALDGSDFRAVIQDPEGERGVTATMVMDQDDVLEIFPGSTFAQSRVSLRVPPPDLGLSSAAGAAGDIMSPMPGKIVKIFAEAGTEVKAGTPLVSMEAMKMEHVLEAPHDGVVGELFALEGDFVKEKSVVCTVV